MENTDLFHKLTNWIDHNRGLVTALALTAMLALWVTACESTTLSPSGSGEQVTWIGLDQEVQAEMVRHDAFIAAANIAVEDLESQDLRRRQFVDFAAGIATTIASGGTLAPAAIITSLVGVGGLLGAGGLFYDNRRKDKVIKKNGGRST